MDQTLFEKIWLSHVVHDFGDGRALIYIDRHLIHDGCAPYGFEGLRRAGRRFRRPDLTLAVYDHVVSTASNRLLAPSIDADARQLIEETKAGCAAHGITLFDLTDRRQGIVHVVGPEQGFILPGATVVCADSHTATHGAFGAFGFGVGVSEAEHVMATQSLIVKRPRTMRVMVEGALGPWVGAKDLILAIIRQIGVGGGVGHVIEYAGEAIRSLSMEARMTLCNMSIEAGARAGLIAPDDTTFAYLKGRPYAPVGIIWDQAIAYWRGLSSDPGAVFDVEAAIDASQIAPVVTWGTNPSQVAAITECVPDPASLAQPQAREACARAISYMGLRAGQPLQQIPIDRVFIGSCTNGRIEDLRAAAAVLANRHVAEGVEAWVVPGSALIHAQAEQEGLAAEFIRAGFQWRLPGCSMCLAMNGEQVRPGERIASTSNRNFEGRQGRGARTHLLSPAMAAAAAVCGRLADVRVLAA